MGVQPKVRYGEIAEGWGKDKKVVDGKGKVAKGRR